MYELNVVLKGPNDRSLQIVSEGPHSMFGSAIDILTGRTDLDPLDIESLEFNHEAKLKLGGKEFK